MRKKIKNNYHNDLSDETYANKLVYISDDGRKEKIIIIWNSTKLILKKLLKNIEKKKDFIRFNQTNDRSGEKKYLW